MLIQQTLMSSSQAALSILTKNLQLEQLKMTNLKTSPMVMLFELKLCFKEYFFIESLIAHKHLSKIFCQIRPPLSKTHAVKYKNDNFHSNHLILSAFFLL